MARRKKVIKLSKADTIYNIKPAPQVIDYSDIDYAAIDEIRNTCVNALAKFDIFKYISQISNENMIGIQPIY